jgi:hypothetical protein
MSILSIACPHCTTPKAPLASIAFAPDPKRPDDRCFGFFICPVCDKAVVAWFNREKTVHGTAWNEMHKFHRTTAEAGWAIKDIWPEPKQQLAPETVPAMIARNFVQASDAASREHWEAAGMAFRRVLELTMKDKGPDLKGTLEKRINKLADQGKLTPDIAEWAHSIRVLGNEAAHDEDEPTEDDITDLAAFTRVTLEYLYTMPAKVARRSSRIEPPVNDEPAA